MSSQRRHYNSGAVIAGHFFVGERIMLSAAAAR